ncbi:major facilitator superfamily domain-containing protein [Penicillium canescens]|nr:major facilitator superfamily domain-containing protein [Penicillium canescens]
MATIATLPMPNSLPSLDEKPEYAHDEQGRTVMVKPIPDAVKSEAGILVDTEGFQGESSLKLAPDGHTVLLPQPTDDPNDPLNWSWAKKHCILITIAWGALCADFTSAMGPSVIFPQAIEWQISPDTANRANSMNVLFGGIGGLIWVPMSSCLGRAPVLFWTTIAGFGFSIGAAVSPTYECYFAMRVLTALFLTAGQTMVIAFIKDLFFFHERARKIGLWAALYIASPYLGPCLGNFIISQTGHWPDVYWLCLGVVGLQVVLVALFVDETWYNRQKDSHEHPCRPAGVANRFLRLLGVWQLQHHKAYFPKTLTAIKRFVLAITRPVVFLTLMIFAWAIGINISTTILFAQPQSIGGYGYSNKGLGFLYFTPIGGVVIGEVFGHFFNDYLARRYVHKHRGVFEPEQRLWMAYISIGLMAPALILVGEALRYHLNVAAIVFGWGTFVVGCMTMSVAVQAYLLDSYPSMPAELGGWLNFARTFGGFGVGYFQSPWAAKVGVDVSFGTQAAIVVCAAIPIMIAHRFGHRYCFGKTKLEPNVPKWRDPEKALHQASNNDQNRFSGWSLELKRGKEGRRLKGVHKSSPLNTDWKNLRGYYQKLTETKINDEDGLEVRGLVA